MIDQEKQAEAKKIKEEAEAKKLEELNKELGKLKKFGDNNQVSNFDNNLSTIFHLNIITLRPNPATPTLSSILPILNQIQNLMPASITSNEDYEYLKGLCIFLNYLTAGNINDIVTIIPIKGLSPEQKPAVAILTLIFGLSKYIEFRRPVNLSYANADKLNEAVDKFRTQLWIILRDKTVDQSSAYNVFFQNGQDLEKSIEASINSLEFYQGLMKQKKIAKNENSQFIIDAFIKINIDLSKKECVNLGGKKLPAELGKLPFFHNKNDTSISKIAGAFSNFTTMINMKFAGLIEKAKQNDTTEESNPDYVFLAQVLRDCDSLVKLNPDQWPDVLNQMKETYEAKGVLETLYAIGFFRVILGLFIQWRSDIVIKHEALNFIDKVLKELKVISSKKSPSSSPAVVAAGLNISSSPLSHAPEKKQDSKPTAHDQFYNRPGAKH